MAWPIDWAKVKPLEEFDDPDPQEQQGVRELSERARKYLESFRWCEEVQQQYVGISVAGIVGVFLCDIIPAEADVDGRVWVIVGDLPSAYITADDAPNPACALDAYIGAMQEWVEAATEGRSVEDLIPVNVEPTPELAERLASRLEILGRHLDAEYPEDLKARDG